ELKITREYNGINFTGKLDKVIIDNDQKIIIDYKYKKNTLNKFNRKKTIVDQIFRRDRKGKLTGLKDSSQMFMYIFLLRNQPIVNGNITANFLFLKENDTELVLSDDINCSLDDEKQFMDTLSQMITSVIDNGVMKPNYQSNLCTFCKLQAICRKKDYYRK
ncbi:PD-(D/E)XK nuclease family protein, partial [bacterium]|nr:PD-(D/E)XK nuclease family protein [bacterium]